MFRQQRKEDDIEFIPTTAANLLGTRLDDTPLPFMILKHTPQIINVPWSFAFFLPQPTMFCDQASNSGAARKGPFPYKHHLVQNHAKLFRVLTSRLQNFPDAVEKTS
ncbi:hypothetical protein COCMIDRAFT_109226 [Bipolaris oryzae ATCC 44560]|uniref:Uncharacterized protein n=1 Tax=Bipolaris oryzae ATCC 44560 TaxID=930090 RepID=W6YM32_COCMI|nr:uncharacterized protein COCMIDRAFT_109226 [Bipolaris oryzae ATCC 44560]EUC40287.1 hypothetical protein COCMIDRAFT_109226 [Bipolaris oryzae ATCC 44560]